MTKDEIYNVKFCPSCGSEELEPRFDVYNERKATINLPEHPEHIRLISCNDCRFYFKINYYDNLEQGEIPKSDRFFVSIQNQLSNLRKVPNQNAYAIYILEKILEENKLE